MGALAAPGRARAALEAALEHRGRARRRAKLLAAGAERREVFTDSNTFDDTDARDFDADPAAVTAGTVAVDADAVGAVYAASVAPVAAQTPQPSSPPPTLGAVALDSRTLRVTLVRPDMNFPSLVSHPVFRPVHELSPGSGLSELRDEQAHGQAADAAGLGIVTNGAFSLSRLAGDSVELERARGYWDAASVRLERVLFVNKSDPEDALAAYRAGELDAVTNASVEPLAVKLLTPYKDFRRETFAALNYYHFNTARAPFDDPRVREALARAVDTERLSADTLGGATEAARGFLPSTGENEQLASRDARPRHEPRSAQPNPSAALVADNGAGKNVGAAAAGLRYDAQRARALLAEAGFPGGAGFPRVRLLVNRNEQQRLVAQAVAHMWREALGVETEILVRPWEEYEAALRSGDYDIARRSLVMQTTDEETNMLAALRRRRPGRSVGARPGLAAEFAARARIGRRRRVAAVARAQRPSRYLRRRRRYATCPRYRSTSRRATRSSNRT